MWPRRALFHSYSPSLVFHNTFQQPPEQCVRRPELARLSAVPTRGAVKDSHLDVFSNLDSGYRLRFPPLIWMLSLELHPLCLFKTKDQWISPVCQQAACRWQWGSDSQHQRSHRCQRSTGKPPSPGPIIYCACVHLLKSGLTKTSCSIGKMIRSSQVWLSPPATGSLSSTKAVGIWPSGASLGSWALKWASLGTGWPWETSLETWWSQETSLGPW